MSYCKGPTDAATCLAGIAATYINKMRPVASENGAQTCVTHLGLNLRNKLSPVRKLRLKKANRWQRRTDSDITDDVTSIEKDEEKNEGGEVMTSVQTIPHNSTIDSFATYITWREENGVTASDILVLMRLQE
ncbi:hypothetical protein NPIL_178531 [Nephila pilipes]|uniref:Uncharacterized protein n=1 Tax=Nephila pilipes TaxID=299642 RepID=A0A8X6N4R4_NEPPI|nr:hypothetical protein NPIL_178531 [Nephila pilipes]